MASPEKDDSELKRELAERQLRFWKLFEWCRDKAQKAMIWGAFFLLLYLFRAFFPLIFLTFVFSFITATFTKALGRWFPKASWKLRVVVVFLCFFGILLVLVSLLIPRVADGYYQGKQTIRDFPTTWQQKIDPWLVENFPGYENLVTESSTIVEDVEVRDANGEFVVGADGLYKTEPMPVTAGQRLHLLQVDAVQNFLSDLEGGNTYQKLPRWIGDLVGGVLALMSLLFLATLFSFLIVFDLKSLSRELKKLEATRLDTVYAEVGRDLAKFGSVLGKVLEAQAIIALVNSILTAIGLFIFDIPNVGILSVIVFICGFIPVAGVFISSVPICLAGLYAHGLPMVVILVGFITAIHFLEAYVLNPRIMGAALRVNPVLVLIILVVGHHALGVWGLLLGLPICYYFFTHVIKKEEREIGLRVSFKKKPEAGPSEA